MDALATSVEQTVEQNGAVVWSLRARSQVIRRRQVLIFGFAGFDEVQVSGCRIEAASLQEAFRPVSEHFAPMPVILHDVALLSRDSGRLVHFSEVDLHPGRPYRLVP